MKLIRVKYGKRGTDLDNREYRRDGRGPVGTIHEFKESLPVYEFEIEDKIDGCPKCGHIREGE